MLNFNNTLISKIISLIIAISFLLADVSYAGVCQQGALRVPMGQKGTRDRMKKTVVATLGIERKFELAQKYSVTKQRGDFLYSQAIKEAEEILELRYGRPFVEKFNAKMTSLNDSGILVEDIKESEDALYRTIAGEYVDFSLRKDQYARFLFDLLRRRQALAMVESRRYDRQGFIETMIVPDGKGSYFVDNASIKGEWYVTLANKDFQLVGNKEIVTMLDTLSYATSQQYTAVTSGSRQKVDLWKCQVGRVYIVDTLNQLEDYYVEGSYFYGIPDRGIAIQVIPERKNEAIFFITTAFLGLERAIQRRIVRDFSGKMTEIAIPTMARAFSPIIIQRDLIPPHNVDLTKLPVLLVSYEYTVGANVLRTALEEQNIPVMMISSVWERDDKLDFMLNKQNLAPYSYFNPSVQKPKIIGFSVNDYTFEQVNKDIAKIRRYYPEAFIVIGGPSTRNPKSLLSMIKGADIIIRGEAEEILPEVLRIVGDSNRETGLDEEQLARLRKLKGIFVRAGRRVLSCHLEHTNIVEHFDASVIDSGINDYKWNITRGCPYKCRFCRISMGRKYRTADLDSMQKAIFELLAMNIPLPKDILLEFSTIVGQDSETLRTLRQWNYIQYDISFLPKDKVIKLLTLLYNNLTPNNQNIAVEIGNILADKSNISDMNYLFSVLPQETPVSSVRKVIMAFRRAWVERLVEEKQDLFVYGLGIPEMDLLSVSDLDNMRFRFPFPDDIFDSIARILDIKSDAVDYGRLKKGNYFQFEDPFRKVTKKQLEASFDLCNEKLLPIEGDFVWEIYREITQTREDWDSLRKRITSYQVLKAGLPESVYIIHIGSALRTIHVQWLRHLYKLYQSSPDPYRSQVQFNKIILTTSEDNTLVNKRFISLFFDWVIAKGLNKYFLFSAGQNTITTLLKGNPDLEFINHLKEADFKVGTLGTDGLTPRILSQNQKGYGFNDAVEVNAALIRAGVPAGNNHIYSTPDSSVLDIAESFLMSGIIPFKLREQGIQEMGINSIYAIMGAPFTNENIALYPDEYKSFSEYSVLLEDKKLTFLDPQARAFISEFEALDSRLSRIEFLRERHPELVEKVIERWQSQEETDPEIRALGRIFSFYRSKYPSQSIFDIAKTVKQDMESRNIYTFKEAMNAYSPAPAEPASITNLHMLRDSI